MVAGTAGRALPSWAVLVPRDAIVVDVRDDRTEVSRRLDAVPSGAWVGIVDDGPGSHRRLHRLARRAGLVVERELVVRSGADASVLVQDTARLGGLGLLRRAAARWTSSDRVVLARRP